MLGTPQPNKELYKGWAKTLDPIVQPETVYIQYYQYKLYHTVDFNKYCDTKQGVPLFPRCLSTQIV